MNGLGTILVIEPLSTESFACLSLSWCCCCEGLRRLCSFYQIISSDHSKDSIEEKFFSIFPYYSSLQHPHNHSFQIPGNDKRWGMNRKILPQCLLINLTRDQHFHISTYILVFLDIWYWNPELFFMIDSGCIVTPLCQTKNITTFSCFNKVRNASGQEYFLASRLSPSTAQILYW